MCVCDSELVGHQDISAPVHHLHSSNKQDGGLISRKHSTGGMHELGGSLGSSELVEVTGAEI